MTDARKKVNLMLDSGAFSAWFHGDDSLDIKAYIAFVRAHEHLIDTCVSLDVIPGTRGRMDRSPEEIDKSAAASYRNHQIMKDAGLSPIPVFHMGERFFWLDKMLAEGEDYIGISPYLRAGVRDIIKWADDCFSAITDSKGRPLVKTHGFGATGWRVLTRYPWTSADSVSWAKVAGFAVVKVPQIDLAGEPDLSRPPVSVYVGSEARSSGSSGTSFDDLSHPEQQRIIDFAAAMGFTMAELRTDHECRKALNIGYFKLIESHAALRVVFASKFDAHLQNNTMTRHGGNNRLLSYFALRDEDPESIERYVRDGTLKIDYRRRTPSTNWESKAYKDYRRRQLVSRFCDGQAKRDSTR